MLFFAFGRERAPRDGVSERRAIPSPVGGRFLLIEKCILAFGRERAPRRVSERRIMPCQQAGDSCREKNAFFRLRPRTSAARRRVREAGHSVASRRAISVDTEMHFGLWPRTSAARRRLGEAGHSVASRRAIPAERRMHLAFGRGRAPRGGSRERRIMPCQQAGASC